MTSKQKHTYSTSDLSELTKELNRLREQGYVVVKGPEFSENAYSVELERDGADKVVAEKAVEAAPAEVIPVEIAPAEAAPEPVTEKPAEPKPAQKPRGPKPKAKAAE